MSGAEKPAKRAAGARLQHVVARRPSSIQVTGGGGGGSTGTTDLKPQSGGGAGYEFPTPSQIFDEVLVFGQKVDALEHIYQAPGRWVYAAVSHGQSFVQALEAAS